MIMRHYRRHLAVRERLADEPDGVEDEETGCVMVELPAIVMEGVEYEVISCASISMIIEAAIAEKLSEEGGAL